jgi:hypothetical protein
MNKILLFKNQPEGEYNISFKIVTEQKTCKLQINGTEKRIELSDEKTEETTYPNEYTGEEIHETITYREYHTALYLTSLNEVFLHINNYDVIYDLNIELKQ